MNRKHLTFFISVSMLLFTACKKETEAPVQYHYEYFPVNLHTVYIYDVDSTVYDDFSGTVSTVEYQVKDSVEEAFPDNAGNLSYKITQYRKDSSGWIYHQQKVINRDDSRAELTEDNIRYIRLVFPVVKSKTWNSNLFNSLPAQINEYTNVHEPAMINGIAYDSTIRVLQANETNLIREIYAEEFYAAGTGLVRKVKRDLHKDISTGKITKGTVYIQQLKSVHP